MKSLSGTGFAFKAGAALSPITGVLTMVGVVISLWGVSLIISALVDGLVAPLLPPIIGTAVFVVELVISYAVTRRRGVLVRSHFKQLLAPAVVRRVLETPDSAKLRSEQREVTALFTDLEGFTAMMHRADPAILVATLDNYFEGMANIIVAHGGTIDKIVGDGIHALFNAPNDLEGHPRKAIECAIALRRWAELFRRLPEVATIGFGRTRIGIETGPAIFGDVGIHAKLDYTAHGDAINVAARLERANKKLGSSICIGPVAASRCDQSLLRPLGKITIRGHDDAMAVFEPWSSDVPYAQSTILPNRKCANFPVHGKTAFATTLTGLARRCRGMATWRTRAAGGDAGDPGDIPASARSLGLRGRCRRGQQRSRL
ncbi:MAG TPA: adenylate/guanylate cyclase domain-containing protein [Xanthobacteraceae bacterium]|nr:adenylate/guanylate cyclase domain-containing protein [Xanthobacteraceae bacterium]